MIAVRNPDGTLSNAVSMQVVGLQIPTPRPDIPPPPAPARATTPLLRAISPTSHLTGRFTVDFYGSNFQQGAKVLAQGSGWSSDTPPVIYDNPTHLQAVIEGNNPASFTLAVRNPDGQLSNAVSIQVTAQNRR
jgi:hypothetical protein